MSLTPLSALVGLASAGLSPSSGLRLGGKGRGRRLGGLLGEWGGVSLGWGLGLVGNGRRSRLGGLLGWGVGGRPGRRWRGLWVLPRRLGMRCCGQCLIRWV